MPVKTIALILIIGFNFPAFCQMNIRGRITDTKSRKALSYVNIGIKGKNIGTISREDGSFLIQFPQDHIRDTLTFSLVGYDELMLPLLQLNPETELDINLNRKITLLNEVVVTGEKLTEKKYGIKRTGIIHFTDGIFKKDDSFEIGQVINLGNKIAKITSLNLHINSSRRDSASFRINFYRYDEDENQPAERLVNKSIIQRHPIKEGWLKFNLSASNIWLKGKVFAAIEFIPENKDVEKIFYEVKIGGSSKSFFRRSSLGQWVRPPHHYCLYATALTDKSKPEEPDDAETTPSMILKSDFSKEPFSIFVRLPKDYSKNSRKTYPVIYQVDGNAFFDPVSSSIEQLVKKKKIQREPILVGIGYENAYVMDSLRARDYTFPTALPADSFGVSGEGANFYKFIKTKVIPRVDSSYRTEKTGRILMGHSLGGYFVLYSLLRDRMEEAIFTNYIAASPSLWYHDSYQMKQFEELPDPGNNQKNTKLYLSVGELEIKDSEANSISTFSQLLTAKQLIRVQPKVYKNMEHMGTALPSFEDGIEFILSK
ncbi:alpha/beta hydrolase-fold protein [Rubrolithibacter danxiaensis]|uniref:alpha/beta hydrolase-fold protein n=1 Tax=Rubrolithibacter danxiaensis TaxID=3390805 RepID=UPI003BF7EFE6